MIAIVIPVLGRPHHIAPLVKNIAANTDVPHRVVFVCSPNDTKALNACKRSKAETITVTWDPTDGGDFAKKVNLAYLMTDEEWIFQGATDIEFKAGWADAALTLAERTGAYVIGTNDEGNPSVIRGKHSTHSLIARSYCDDPGASMDGPGSVFSTAYKHQFVDNELVGLAKSRGVWAFSSRSIVRHNHPSWGRSETDEIYDLGISSFETDRVIFGRRRLMWTRGQGRIRRRRPGRS